MSIAQTTHPMLHGGGQPPAANGVALPRRCSKQLWRPVDSPPLKDLHMTPNIEGMQSIIDHRLQSSSGMIPSTPPMADYVLMQHPYYPFVYPSMWPYLPCHLLPPNYIAHSDVHAVSPRCTVSPTIFSHNFTTDTMPPLKPLAVSVTSSSANPAPALPPTSVYGSTFSPNNYGRPTSRCPKRSSHPPGAEFHPKDPGGTANNMSDFCLLESNVAATLRPCVTPCEAQSASVDGLSPAHVTAVAHSFSPDDSTCKLDEIRVSCVPTNSYFNDVDGHLRMTVGQLCRTSEPQAIMKVTNVSPRVLLPVETNSFVIGNIEETPGLLPILQVRNPLFGLSDHEAAHVLSSLSDLPRSCPYNLSKTDSDVLESLDRLMSSGIFEDKIGQCSTDVWSSDRGLSNESRYLKTSERPANSSEAIAVNPVVDGNVDNLIKAAELIDSPWHILTKAAEQCFTINKEVHYGTVPRSSDLKLPDVCRNVPKLRTEMGSREMKLRRKMVDLQKLYQDKQGELVWLRRLRRRNIRRIKHRESLCRVAETVDSATKECDRQLLDGAAGVNVCSSLCGEVTTEKVKCATVDDDSYKLETSDPMPCTTSDPLDSGIWNRLYGQHPKWSAKFSKRVDWATINNEAQHSCMFLSTGQDKGGMFHDPLLLKLKKKKKKKKRKRRERSNEDDADGEYLIRKKRKKKRRYSEIAVSGEERLGYAANCMWHDTHFVCQNSPSVRDTCERVANDAQSDLSIYPTLPHSTSSSVVHPLKLSDSSCADRLTESIVAPPFPEKSIQRKKRKERVGNHSREGEHVEKRYCEETNLSEACSSDVGRNDVNMETRDVVSFSSGESEDDFNNIPQSIIPSGNGYLSNESPDLLTGRSMSPLLLSCSKSPISPTQACSSLNLCRLRDSCDPCPLSNSITEANASSELAIPSHSATGSSASTCLSSDVNSVMSVSTSVAKSAVTLLENPKLEHHEDNQRGAQVFEPPIDSGVRSQSISAEICRSATPETVANGASPTPVVTASAVPDIKLQLCESDLINNLPVLIAIEGLLYPGHLIEIFPPDVYGIKVTGERSTRPHVYSQEEILRNALVDTKLRKTVAGQRVCAFWSNQHRFLFPGTIADDSDNSDNEFLSINFDDGDCRATPYHQVRLLPNDYPSKSYSNSLELLGLRKRSTSFEGTKRATTNISPAMCTDESKRRASNAKIRVISREGKSSEIHVYAAGSMKPSSVNNQEAKTKNKTKKKKKTKHAEKADEIHVSPRYSGLPSNKVWHWIGSGIQKRGSGRSKKIFYNSIIRGKERIKVGDSGVFLTEGSSHLPYIGKVENLWETATGRMVVKVKWFYHPEETKAGRRPYDGKNALFLSSHVDENDIQTILNKCHVLSYDEYCERGCFSGSKEPKWYYSAGTYDAVSQRILEDYAVKMRTGHRIRSL